MKTALLVICFLFSSGSLQSQINFKNVTAGLSAKYLIPRGDLGKYWQRSQGAGVLLGYTLQNQFSLESEIAYSKIKSKNDNPAYPDIHFIELSGGVKYNYQLWKNLYINLKPGLQNCMFIFSGAAADQIYEQNKTESEFGFFISGGIIYEFGKGIKLEINCRVLSILSSPETINIFIPGITIFLL